KPLLAAGSDLTEAVNEASIAVATVSPAQRYKLTFKTAWGMVVLAGGSTETYANEIPTCLIIDTGGNDAYINQPANKGAANWLSVVIDTDGKDRYVSDPALLNTELSKWGGRKKRQELGPAGAAFGFSFLTDTQGDDVYTSHLAGLGSAFFGVAVLQDWAGADRYYGYKNCEGAATFGVGLLEDRKGDDVYHAFTQAQGFGGIQGGGGVIDRDGNDRYTAEDTIIDFPSAQSAQHNTSFAQGSALGRRADYLEGHSLAGGFGLLYDEAGDDRYSASVFGQGAGYWAGVGALMDNSGDDQYSGQWYVQGAAAHFAVGYLEDIAGKDLYRAPMNMAMGAGHDFSLGMLIEGGGSDSYNAPNLSLGAGNANGIGVFVDKGGDDFYTSTGITLGMSADSQLGTLREIALSLGVFIDFGGDDSFPVTVPHAKNSTRTANWVRRQAPAESLVGVFLDK
ncbi:MAG: hypothetical protein K8R88_04060, partial [Armatimonadetes bacterium]|nr:hypothetical protein [Armatimonadota bacterium]